MQRLQHPRHAPRPRPPAAAPSIRPAPDTYIGPILMGTYMLLASIGLAWLLMGGATGSGVAHRTAVIVGIGIVLSAITDFQCGGMPNVVRADLFAILSFYFLTLFEFLFPQANYDKLVTPQATVKAVVICLWAFAGLAIGRHLMRGRGQPFRRVLTTPISSNRMMALFLGCVLGGYLNMLVAVHFNVFEMVDAFMWPRFSQPWSRGRLGDWKALFEELGMILFLVPPMAGIMLARRRGYNLLQLSIVLASLLFTLFYGYTGGTRHIFDSYLVTFLIGYAFAMPKERRLELIPVAGVCAVLLVFSTITMTKFREIGLKDYMSGPATATPAGGDQEVLAVDLNLYPMSMIADVIPAHHDYLGFEIIYQAIIRPIPRALWKGKPEGMSVSIESIVGAGEGWTVAASFAGEAYMSGGVIAVFVIAAGFGWMSAWWNRLISEDNSELGWLIYASGFFSVVISMRSLLVFTTDILPTIAAFAVASYVIGKGVDKAQRVLHGPRRAVPVRTRPVTTITRR